MKNPLYLSLLTIGFISLSTARNFSIDSTDAFKIVQFTNLYIDDDATNYAYTMQLVQNVIDAESPVDLVVLTGNTVDPDFEEAYTDRFSDAIAYLSIMGIPWVSTGGEDRPDVPINRDYMLQKDQQIGADQDLSYSGYYNKDSTYGIYTQKIPVQKTDGSHAFNVWIMDSQGGYDCYGSTNGKACVSNEAVSWFKTEIASTSTSGKGDIIFTNYPLQEMMTLANTYKVYGLFDQQVCCQAQNTGLFQAAVDSGKVGWISCGGDVDNDFKGTYDGINLAYGRKSGFGGTGGQDRGARVFKINVDDNGIYWTQTWVRDFDGDIITQDDQLNTMPTNFTAQAQCCTIYDDPDRIQLLSKYEQLDFENAADLKTKSQDKFLNSYEVVVSETQNVDQNRISNKHNNKPTQQVYEFTQ